MWLSIPIVVGIVAGIVLALAGAGVFGIPILIIALIAAGIAFAGRVGAERRSGGARPAGQDPQDTVHRPQSEADTGFAHRGQAHMTPE